MTRSRSAALTILEVLVVVAVVGIVAAIASVSIPRERIAVSQAVERFERDLARARFSAVSANTTLVFTVDPATNSYEAVPQDGTSGGFRVDDVSAAGGGVDVSVIAGTPTWSFDARGVGRKSDLVTLQFASLDGSFSRSIEINQYGRTR